MDVRNCKKCGKLFNYNGEPLCPPCAKELEEKFFEVREYIYNHPNESMVAVSENTDVPVQQIKRWIRQERLTFTKESGVAIDCELCGKAILTGRYCKECKHKMQNSFSSMYREPAKKDSSGKTVSSNGKMRFLGN